ncbi:uncharacterized protein LOC100898176 [Galendromus occidentalis]|uniref:Uncharacterized protein LOC100898176 n=1 Tax=Galendromus occidentalis TaxID=34638 RepID=A0AAJ6QSV8_9ACAR|nr:uncharacterized protein LOC100898176 [Galendromus occidentalis]
MPKLGENRAEDDGDLEIQFRKFVEADAYQLEQEKSQSGEDFIEKFRRSMTFDETERRYPVAVMADIEKSFPQIMIHEVDRDALRFLWDRTESGQPQTFRLARNYFGLGPSPFILAMCIRTLLESYSGPHAGAIEEISHSSYVDDLVASVPSHRAAETLYRVAGETFLKGSFRWRKWLSSSEHMMETFKRDAVSVEESPTKRRRVQSVGVGFVAPVTMRAKVIMQQVYKIPKMKWNDKVPENIAQAVRKWAEDITRLDTVEIPRCYGTTDRELEKLTVHIFGDASGIAYGVVAYLVVAGPEAEAQSSFLMARSRIAPMEKASIPRLELMAMCLAAETCAYLMDRLRLEVGEYHLWTDSASVFHQVNSQQEEKMPIFVRNRVTEIRKLIGEAKIHHVPGELNLADLVSRGCGVTELSRSSWFVGPEFVKKSVSEWPAQPELPKLTVALVTANVSVETVFEIDRFGSWLRRKRSMAIALRFIDITRKRRSRNKAGAALAAAELRRAEDVIMQQLQREAYGKELNCARGNRIMPEESKLRPLRPIFRAGFLRLGSRLAEHQGDVVKDPPIIPEKHRATMLYLKDLHARHCHAGINHCLVEARKRYWIPRCRQRLRHIIHQCQNCRRFQLKPATAKAGDPPALRVSHCTYSHTMERSKQ